MDRFPCPHLEDTVELTAERAQHIRERHPELGPDLRERIATTLRAPDRVRAMPRSRNSLLFTRWYDDVRGGKHHVVVVVTTGARHWIVTAYTARRLAGALEEGATWQHQ